MEKKTTVNRRHSKRNRFPLFRGIQSKNVGELNKAFRLIRLLFSPNY